MSTYNMVTVAAAIRASRDKADLTAKELTEYAIEEGLIQRTQLLGSTEARLQAVRKDLYAMNADKLATKIKYRQAQSELAYKLMSFNRKQLFDDRENIQRLMDEANEARKKLDQQSNQRDDNATRDLNRAFRATQAGTSAASEAKGRLQALVSLTRSPDFKDQVNPGIKKGQANSMYEWMEKINAAVAGSEDRRIFDLDTRSRSIRNLDALKDADNPKNPLRKAGLSRGEIISAFEPEGASLFDQYQRNAEATFKAKQETDALIEKLDGQADILRNAKTVDDITAIDFNQLRDDIIRADESFFKGSGINTSNLNQLTEEMRIYEGMKRSEKRLEQQAEALVRKNPDAAVQLRDAMARRMSSPYIRAWAKDNGFDELGHVTVKDGQYDPESYIPGRDDLAVVAAFNRQAKRGAGRYGFKSIGTGDIVQVTVDGEPVVGERLKYHAADRVGTVRVMTESGEVLTFAPGELDQVVVIERRPDRMSPLEQRAKGRAYRMGDQIRAARERAGVAVPGSELGAKVIEGGPNDGSFVIDPDNGRYIDTAEYNQAIDDYLRNDAVQGKIVDGKQYLVRPFDGTMFEVVPGEGLVPVTDTELAKEVTAARPRRVVGQFAVEGQAEPQARLLNRADTNVAGLEIVMEPLEGEANYSEDTKKYFDDAADTKRAGVGLPELGYKATDQKFSSLAGQTYKNEYNIGGMKFVELDKAPPIPPSPSEGLTPGVDGPAEQPTGMPGITQQIETAAAQMGERPETPETVTDQPTEPERVDKGEIEVDPVASQWNMQAQLNAAKGEPPPAVPEGYEVVQGEGLRKITEQPAPTPQQPPTPPADELDTSAIDLEAITGTPQPTPAPTPATPPVEVLSDAEIDAIGASDSDDPIQAQKDANDRMIARLQAMTAQIQGKGKGKGKGKRKGKRKDEKVKLPPDAASVIDVDIDNLAKQAKKDERQSKKNVPPPTPTPTEQAEANADATVEAATNIVESITDGSDKTEEQDEVNKDSGKVTSGTVYGQTHADSMKKLKDLEERVKQFQSQQQKSQEVTSVPVEMQGLGTPPTQ